MNIFKRYSKQYVINNYFYVQLSYCNSFEPGYSTFFGKILGKVADEVQF